ncbi:MAG TPA: TlyA family RNA methyltransferase [Pyrinomonadaceae bacterium]|nr:TlyA family RNA methyltransferase [Pyrinomonadaceae bacterium]
MTITENKKPKQRNVTPKEKKVRIDKLLFERGFAESRQRALAMILAGVVIVEDKKITKPSEAFHPDVSIRIKGRAEQTRFVSRGGLKLESAIETFRITVSGKICLDVGSSTGGFTDCLLQNGAKRVYAVDAGYNQLDWRLRNDERVVVREKTNARYLTTEDFDEKFGLSVIDVSFISLKLILPAIAPLMEKGADMVVLIKPQFEVGKGEVEKGGIVKDAAKREKAVKAILDFAENLGLEVLGVIESPIKGAQGNIEYLAHFKP